MINSLGAVAAGAMLFAGATTEWVNTESTSAFSSKVAYEAISPSSYPSSHLNFHADTESWIGLSCKGESTRVYFGLTNMPKMLMHDDPLIAKVRFNDDVREISIRQPSSQHYLNPTASDQAYLLEGIQSSDTLSLELTWSNIGSVQFDYNLDGAKSSISTMKAQCKEA
ncbi:hypothetical protein [Enterovibrio calviensis]|uniref:hypothetical protein n=1 Tax=Enterovibrio calviensis TaxID=91359 RepID=UPI003736A012